MRSWSFRETGTRAGAGLAAVALTASMIVAGAAAARASAPAWQLVHSPDATLTGGTIESVSCSSAGACTAVGDNLNPAGIKVTLAERWNGSTWQRQRTPNPPQDTVPSVSPDLRGVACPAAAFCMAVGAHQLGGLELSMAEMWNGRRWTWQPVPLPAGADWAGLNSVSCVSAAFCEAVGAYQGSSGLVTLAVRWNGTSWRIQRTPSPAGFVSEQLNTVSCASATFCEAWGGGNSGNPGPEIAEQWNGKAWRLQTVPSSAAVNAVSCFSATFCEAVGSGAAAYRWNGLSWGAQTVPSPAGSGILGGVSCVSKTFCEAVGEYSSGSVVGVAAVWTGSAWRAQSTPNPPGAAFTHLNGVSCASAKSCETAGDFRVNTTTSDAKALAEAWNGSAWLLQRAVAPPGATFNTLAAVSCVSATFCEAVGTHDNSAGAEVDLAEEWNGKVWAIQSTPGPHSPDKPASGALTGVSCVSVSFCEAVGSGPNGASAEMWTGTSWKAQTMPGTAVQPTVVSCADVDFCMSVDGFGRVDIWNGSSWSAASNVPGFSGVSAVSCASPSYCEVVGGGPSGEDAAMWDGSAWSAQPTPGPVSLALSAISCPQVNSCEAVGSYRTQSSSQQVTLAEIWDGSAWARQRTPNPSAAQGSSLQAVSCTAADACTAVGDYQYSNLALSDTLAEVWDGTAWRLRTTPNIANAGQNLLSGVACGASQTCAAVGQTQDVGLIPATLIEIGD